MGKHEAKCCPRCSSTFECRVGDVGHCQCYGISLSEEEKRFIETKYADCLCRRCLYELKSGGVLFREKFFGR